MKNKYSAFIYFDNKPLNHTDGNDLNKLMVTLLNDIENTCASSHAVIINNITGNVVQRLKKTFVD